MFARILARLGWSAALLLVVSGLAPCADAQLTDATLKGLVVDPKGARIASSAATAISENTKEARSATTDGDGRFVMTSLPPGSYTVQVTVPGFKTFYEKHVTLDVGQATELAIRLEVGDVQETVEVSAEESRLPVAMDARLSDTLEQNRISELPVAQRDIFGLTHHAKKVEPVVVCPHGLNVVIEPVLEIATMRIVGVDIRVPKQHKIAKSRCIVLEGHGDLVRRFWHIASKDLSKGIDPVGSRPLYRQREGAPSGYRRQDAIAFADCTFPDVLEPPGLEVARHCH
jgi:hypothetical protein